jgi:hypothetical protein
MPRVELMDQLDRIGIKRVNLQVIAIAAGLMVAAIAVGWLGYAEVLTLRIRSLRLGSWSMYVAACGLFAFAGFVLWAGFYKHVCRECGDDLAWNEAYFPLDAEAVVVRATALADTAYLSGLPRVPKAQMKMALDISYCTGCGNHAIVAVEKWENYRNHKLTEPQIVQGPRAQGFRALALAHVQFRAEHGE